jgi:hypothetical protein
MDKITKVTPKPPTYPGDNHSYVSELAMVVDGLRSKAYPEPKTTGIKMRGAGAATKGVMCRGPMG